MPDTTSGTFPARRALLLHYAKAHQFRGLLIGLAFVGSCQALAGSWQLQLPSAGPDGMRSMPLRLQLPILAAALVAGSLHSSMAAFEETATGGWRRLEAAHLVAATLVGTTVVVGTGASSQAEAGVLARSMLIWTGMAVASGRVLGRQLSWVIPVLSVFPLFYWGIDGWGQARWWDWTHQPVTFWPCWWLAVGSVALGSSAYWMTPWRSRRARAALAAIVVLAGRVPGRG